MIPKDEAENLGCPQRPTPHGFGRCITQHCMAWAWDPNWRQPRLKEILAEDVDVGDPEPPRPPHVPASWDWIPVRVDGDGDLEGGLWIEPADAFGLRMTEAHAKRPGYCRLFAAPRR